MMVTTFYAWDDTKTTCRHILKRAILEDDIDMRKEDYWLISASLEISHCVGANGHLAHRLRNE